MSGGAGFLPSTVCRGQGTRDDVFFPSKNAADIFWILSWGRTVQVFPSPVHTLED